MWIWGFWQIYYAFKDISTDRKYSGFTDQEE